MITSFIKSYIKTETFSGVLLMVVSALALIVANIPSLYPTYEHFQHLEIGIKVGGFVLQKSFLHWVNDGLMALFFFLISLEIKREVLQGELSTFKKAFLPVMGAIGGMVVPAFIFFVININSPENLNGWAIPMATDIAFALGIILLLGKRVPVQLKIFLTTLAVVDDLGAILVLAIFYSNDINIDALMWASVLCFVLFIMSYMRVVSASLYMVLGGILWFFLLKSGIHATLAGVITALAIPSTKCRNIDNPIENLEHRLHYWVSFFILPIFAFLNAGVVLPDFSMSLITPLSTGIVFGLLFGKQIGVFGFAYMAIKLKWARLPTSVTLLQLYGISVLTGVGFTMSLFIASLAFSDPLIMNSVRLSIIIGSLLSAFLGIFLLFVACWHKKYKRRKRA